MASICSNSEMATLFVGNLHLNATEAELVELFTTFGPISSISVYTETVIGRSHCYAYINYQKEIDAKYAMETLKLELGSNCTIRITWFKPDAGKIFISKLDKRMKSKDIRCIFAEFGNILSCEVAKNDLSESIGCAFVHFETEEAADACIKFCHGEKLLDEVINVEKFDVCQANEDELDEKKKLVMGFKMAIRNALFKSTEDSEQPKTDGEVEIKGESSFVEKSNQLKGNEEKLDEKTDIALDKSVKVCEQQEIDCDVEVMQITSTMGFMNQYANLKQEKLDEKSKASEVMQSTGVMASENKVFVRDNKNTANVRDQTPTKSSIQATIPKKVKKDMVRTQQEQGKMLTQQNKTVARRLFGD